MDAVLDWAPTVFFGGMTFGIVSSLHGRWFYWGPPVATQKDGSPAWDSWTPLYVEWSYGVLEVLQTWAWFAFNMTQAQAGIDKFTTWGGNTGPVWADYRWGGPNTAGSGYDPPVPEGRGYDKKYGPHFGLYMLAAWGLSLFFWML